MTGVEYLELVNKIKTNIKSVKILCVGDVMIDRYCYGTVTRISPEAPVPIVEKQYEKTVLGGAGNVIANVASLGAQSIFFTIVGQDDKVNIINDLCAKIPGLDYHLSPIANTSSTEKTRIIADKQQIARIDEENFRSLSLTENEQFLQKILPNIKNADIVILSDYNKGCLNKWLNHAIIQEAQRHNISTIVDPQITNYDVYQGASYIKPNFKELQATCNLALADDNAIAKAAHDLIEQYNLTGLLITRSHKGMTLVDKNLASPQHISTQAQEVFDVSGAGDTAIAAFAIALALKCSSLEAALFANYCAGIVIGKLGTATILWQELQCTV